MLGRIIDELPDEARDRLVRAQNWTYGEWTNAIDNSRCFVMHVQDDEAIIDAFRQHHRVLPPCAVEDTVLQFDKLCRRFGKDRIVRAIKKRAGANLDIGDVADADVTDSREPATANA